MNSSVIFNIQEISKMDVHPQRNIQSFTKKNICESIEPQSTQMSHPELDHHYLTLGSPHFRSLL